MTQGVFRRFLSSTALSSRFKTVLWIGLLVVVGLEILSVVLGGEGSDPQGLAELITVCVLVMLASLGVTWGTLVFLLFCWSTITLWDPNTVTLGAALIAVLVARTATLRFGVVCAVLYGVWSLTQTLIHASDVLAMAISDVLVVAGAALGLLLRRQGDRMARFHRDLAAQTEQREADVEAERRQIARELHDVVAHGLTIVALQSSVLQMVSTERERSEAATAIGDAARQSLVDLRRLLAVLHGSERAYGVDEEEMTISLTERVGEFVDRLRSAGFTVECAVQEPEDLSRSLRLTLIRIFQECTTNILKHAVPPATVCLGMVSGPQGIEVTVSSPLPGRLSDAPLPASGFGMPGMRERVELFGGTVQGGPQDGDWVVQAQFPASRTA